MSRRALHILELDEAAAARGLTLEQMRRRIAVNSGALAVVSAQMREQWGQILQGNMVLRAATRKRLTRGLAVLDYITIGIKAYRKIAVLFRHRRGGSASPRACDNGR
ncbi:MAG: hypothetical protein ACI30W_07745 [Muribaculaceae bacterium]